jgi:hypothetical protein
VICRSVICGFAICGTKLCCGLKISASQQIHTFSPYKSTVAYNALIQIVQIKKIVLKRQILELFRDRVVQHRLEICGFAKAE